MSKSPTPPTQKSVQDEYVRTALRIPSKLRDELQDAGAQHGRTMNAEIIDRLQAAPLNVRIGKLERELLEMKAMIREILIVVSGR